MQKYSQSVEPGADGACHDRRSKWRMFAEQSNYKPVKMAELCQVSLRHLERQFKVEIGETPRNWLKRQRLKSALRLLPEAQSIKEVSYALGYCQLSQFCREFKLGFGLTPTAFKQMEKVEQDRLMAREIDGEAAAPALSIPEIGAVVAAPEGLPEPCAGS